jgi:septal ring factor EnvC (AmiA/AmiB activator)
MGLGSATRKIQQVADIAEKLYERLNELRAQVQVLNESVSETRERVATLEHTVERQGALIEALAEKEGIDVDRIYTELAIEEAESGEEEETLVGEADTETEAEIGAESDVEADGNEQ